MFVALFCILYVDHRDLHVRTHSCPTRRSSDLVVPANVAPSDVAPSDLAPAPDEIVVTAREAPPPGDQLQEANITSYRVIQSVDKALAEPVATGYQRVLPATVRERLGNALRKFSQYANFLNFLLTLQTEGRRDVQRCVDTFKY